MTLQLGTIGFRGSGSTTTQPEAFPNRFAIHSFLDDRIPNH